MNNRVLLVAGEASGDLHGSGVVRALKELRPELDLFGIGGDRMKREGMDVVVHIARMSFMGFAEVLKNLGTIRQVMRMMEGLLETRRPDVVVLIDYPGFNLRFAKRAARKGIPVLYYISPQVWAWHRSRVRKMKGSVRSMKVVFPFEVDIYRNEGMDVEFVGHPIVERIGCRTSREEFFALHGLDPRKKLLALLPGSRLQEIQHILPVMLEAARLLSDNGHVQVALGVAPNLGVSPILPHLKEGSGVTLVENATYDLMAHADAAVVTSGTATLETGWFGTPMVVVYKTSPVTFFIGRLLVSVPYIGLVNIVAGKKVAPELIQRELTAQNLVKTVQPLLNDGVSGAAMRTELSVIRERLGKPGASRLVAKEILKAADKG
jgi:lipid-A-disaccharide synthase